MIYFVSTKADERVCVCGGLILAAIDEGRPVQVDAQPVDRAGEIQALLDNRLTFARLHSGELAHRHEGRIRHGLVGESIHAQHRCPVAPTQPTLCEGIRS